MESSGSEVEMWLASYIEKLWSVDELREFAGCSLKILTAYLISYFVLPETFY